MQSAKLEFWIPAAEVPEGTDPLALETRITAELKAFQEQLKPDQVQVGKPQKEPVPEGAAGISELVTWGFTFYFQHKEEIHAALPLLAKLLSGISAAVRYYMHRKGKKKKDEVEPVVRLKIGNQEIDLPAESASIEEFVKRVSEQMALVSEKKK